MLAAPVHDQTGAAVLFLCQSYLQQNANLDSLDEARPLVTTKDPTYRIDDLIHLSQRHAVYLLVVFIEVRPYALR